MGRCLKARPLIERENRVLIAEGPGLKSVVAIGAIIKRDGIGVVGIAAADGGDIATV